MAESLTATALAQLIWTLTNPLDQSTPTDTKTLTITAGSFTSGTGLNQVNQLWHDRRTLASSASENIDLYDFGPSNDSLGIALTQVKLKVLCIYNRILTAGENLKIGGEGSGASWQSFFQVSGSASDTAGGILGPGGLFLIVNPSLAAYTVADTSNHLLKITNSGSGGIDYDIIVMGTNA